MSDPFAGLAARIEQTPYAASLGVRVESIESDRVRLRVPFKDENANPGRALHGGVAASTIDIAGALVAWTALPPRPETDIGTLDLAVDYLAAAIGEDVVATAEVLRRGKELVYSDVDVRNDAGKRIAKGLSTYRVFDRTTEAAYAERQRFAAGNPPPSGAADVPRNARVFVAVPFIARLGMSVVHAHDGEAFMSMPARAEFADTAGAVHEGAIAALIDTTGAMASWSITGLDFSYKASTVGIHVSFHAPARGDLLAHARVQRRSNEIFLNTVEVSERASGRIVAGGSVTYRIVIP